ncbi:MAG TPA: M20/M25/M40 family metallo-hydrolase [Thermomicrobiales bacterium]|nr:M20/M25/M40 family metallo-hydrolase [Thermomicrobiales bacterium]
MGTGDERHDLKGELGELLAELAGLDGVAGHEHAVVARLRDLFAPASEDVTIDSFGNLFARINAEGSGPVLMISAHSDEIGALVKSIEPGGMLRIERVGGLIESLAIGRHVRVRGHRGVIGVKAGHIQTADERGRAPSFRELYVDIGFDSAAEVEALGIRVGDAVAYDEPMERLANRDRVSGKALDNRVSCAVLVKLAERLNRTSLGCTLYCVVTVQEEVGLRGARMAAHRLAPAAAVVGDTAPSGGPPDVDFHRDLRMRIGGGPVLGLASAGGSAGHHINPAMRDFLREAADDCGVALQEALFYGGTSDASAVHLVRDGIPTGVINIARRYSHSPVETLDLNDVVDTLVLLDTAARRFGPDVDLGFLTSAWG